MFDILQSLSLAGGSENIDYIRATERCVLLLDGSTPLIKSNYATSRFTELFAKCFFELFEAGESATDAINGAIANVYEDFKTCVENNDVGYFPSATLVLAYMENGKLCIINIGDSTALVVMKNGKVVRISSDDVPRFDNSVIDRMKQIRSHTGMDMSDIIVLPEIREMLVKNRGFMNKPDGYRIVAFEMESVGEKDIIRFDASKVERIILHSDGFDDLGDELLSPDANLEQIYANLRKMENDDYLMNKYPRLKVSDDASAVIFTIHG